MEPGGCTAGTGRTGAAGPQGTAAADTHHQAPLLARIAK